MKKLEFNQMENLEGGIDQRNCMILGGVIVASAVGGFFSVGAAWFATVAAIGAAGASGCF
jgi:hypothetical protein